MAALESAVAILVGQATALGIAVKNGHPLAGELAAILESMAAALREFVRAPAQNRREAVLVLVEGKRDAEAAVPLLCLTGVQP